MNTLKAKLDKEVDEIISEASKVKTAKVSISLKLDSDIYLELKKLAAEGKSGGKYQRLLNETLRASLFKGSSVEDRLERLEKAILSS